MLGLFLPPSDAAEWVHIPRRTFLPEVDPNRGRTAICEQLLDLDANRQITVRAITQNVAMVSRTDVRGQVDNPSASQLDSREVLGPALLIGTASFYDKSSKEAIRLIDFDPAALNRTIRNARNSPETARIVAAPVVRAQRSVLTVRSLPPMRKGDGDAADAFSEVMDVVSEYVEATQCLLSSPQSGFLPDGRTFYYSAAVEHPAEHRPE